MATIYQTGQLSNRHPNSSLDDDDDDDDEFDESSTNSHHRVASTHSGGGGGGGAGTHVSRTPSNPSTLSDAEHHRRCELTIEIPHATASYTPMGLHVRYSLQCVSHDDSLRWVVHKRYTECRSFHSQLLDALAKREGGGKLFRFVTQSFRRSPLPPFPEKLLGTSSNRTRVNIDARRIALEKYFQNLCDTHATWYSLVRPYLMGFIAHPDVCIGNVILPNTPPDVSVDTTPGASTSTTSGGGGDQEREAGSESFPFEDDSGVRPTTVETVWRVKKEDVGVFDRKLLVSRPCAEITVDVDDNLLVVLKAEKSLGSSASVVLQHRYNEFVAFCRYVDFFKTVLPTCDEAHGFFMSYRMTHPLTQKQSQHARNPYGRETRPPTSPESSHALPHPSHPTVFDLVPPTTNHVTPFTMKYLSREGVPGDRRRRSTNSTHLVDRSVGVGSGGSGVCPFEECKCTDLTLCREVMQWKNVYVTKCHLNIVVSPPEKGEGKAGK
eukprot:PhF_6_TR13660/c0_g1_i1/m.21932